MAEPTDTETRGPINLRIKFRSASLEQFIERYSVDVSRGGIFIRTREPLAVGTRLKFDFQLLEAGPLLQGEGTVVWIREYDPGRATVTPGMGVRFDRLSPESQQRLEKILSEKERLNQGGTAPGVITKSGAGIAVRRPTGTNPALELPASGAPPSAGSSASTANTTVSPSPFAVTAPVTASEARASAPPPPPPPSAAGAPAAQPRSTGIFGRPRTTTGGLSALRSGPVPSALFEPPTAADIDKALQVLEDRPGPVPAMPPPPRFSPGGGDPTSTAPGPVRDDPSNEPTRVVETPHEFGAHEALTGRADVVPEVGMPSGVPVAPISGGDELTARSPLGDSTAVPTLGAPPPAPASALDEPLGDHLDEPPQALAGDTRRSSIESAPIESGRFRADATYRRSRPSALKAVVAVVVLGGAAAALYYVKVRPQPAPVVEVTPNQAAPAPPPAPETPPPGAAADNPAAPAPEVPVAPAPEVKAKQEEQRPKSAGVKAESDSPKSEAKAESKSTGDGERSGSSKRKRRDTSGASAGSAAAPPAGGGAAPAAGAGTGGEAAPAAAAPAASEAPPADAPPVLKITSTPAGAEVVIDGSAVGTTPFQTKDLDPTAPHAITVRKDGFEPHERMISGSDWSRGRGGAQSLKMNVKLRKVAGEGAGEKNESSGDKASDVEVLTPD